MALPWLSCGASSLPASCATSASGSPHLSHLTLSTQANHCRWVLPRIMPQHCSKASLFLFRPCFCFSFVNGLSGFVSPVLLDVSLETCTADKRSVRHRQACCYLTHRHGQWCGLDRLDASSEQHVQLIRSGSLIQGNLSCVKSIPTFLDPVIVYHHFAGITVAQLRCNRQKVKVQAV
jgi:hypothetical protein